MTQKIPASHAIKELTLLLAYLTHFSENEPFETARSYRSWKGYDFDVLNSLDELGWIDQGSFRSKSLYLTDEGLQKAQDLLEKYGIEDCPFGRRFFSKPFSRTEVSGKAVSTNR